MCEALADKIDDMVRFHKLPLLEDLQYSLDFCFKPWGKISFFIFLSLAGLTCLIIGMSRRLAHIICSLLGVQWCHYDKQQPHVGFSGSILDEAKVKRDIAELDIATGLQYFGLIFVILFAW